MNDQPHSHGDHPHDHGPAKPAPETPIDPGSQALSEALRSSFAIVKVVMGLLVLAFFASGFFEVGPQEQAIILRFGRPVGEGRDALLGPGLHWSYPYPIDEVVKISTTGLQQVQSTVGWFATTAAQEAAGAEPPPRPSVNPAVDGYVVTADGNIVHLRATLYYRIDDPVSYTFGFTNAARLVQNDLNQALVQTAARFKVDDILTADVTGFRDAVRQRAAELLDQHRLGVVVDRCEVQQRAPPFLRGAFESVVNAGQARRTAIDNAQKHRNQVLSQAVADGQSLTNRAESDRAEYVARMNSLARSFEKLGPEYEKNPQLFVQRRLSETLGQSLTNSDKWVLPAPVDGKSQELRLQLNREAPRSRNQNRQ